MTESEYEATLSGLVHECEELRARVSQLEDETDRYRAQEHLLSKTLLAATAFAEKVRAEARREAELTLRKARSKARQRNAKATNERDYWESELARLRQVADETHKGLAALLTGTLGQLRMQAVTDTPGPEPTADLEGVLATSLRRTVENDTNSQSR